MEPEAGARAAFAVALIVAVAAPLQGSIPSQRGPLAPSPQGPAGPPGTG
jgi:hypothetical protein